MNPPEKIHCIEIEYRINAYVRLIPMLLWVTSAIVLNDTNPKIRPLKKRLTKLNQKIEFLKKLIPKI